MDTVIEEDTGFSDQQVVACIHDLRDKIPSGHTPYLGRERQSELMVRTVEIQYGPGKSSSNIFVVGYNCEST